MPQSRGGAVHPAHYSQANTNGPGWDSEKERIAGIQAAFAKKGLPTLEPGAMVYMMSKESYLSDPSRQLFACDVFLADEEIGLGKAWVVAARAPWDYFILVLRPGREYAQAEELPPLRLMFIAVPKWSDGTSITAK